LKFDDKNFEFLAGWGLETLALMRHADAGDPVQWRGSDQDRPLTEKGLAQAHLSSLGLLTLCVPTFVMTSDYVRAVQTADVTCRVLADDRGKHLPSRLVSPTLRPEADPQEWMNYMSGFKGMGAMVDMPHRTLLVVGHEPFLSVLAEMIFRQPSGFMPKAGLLLIHLDEVGRVKSQRLFAPGELAQLGS
jgi:phosphohistidine phosphatase